MAKFPRLQVTLHHGWYLSTRGCHGSAALLYLPAYNDFVRNRYIRKGYKLLSDCGGDISQPGSNALFIRPPSDEAIRMVIETLQARVKDEDARLVEEIETTKQRIEETEGDERRLLRTRKAQLERARKDVGSGIPGFAELKRHFIDEYNKRMRMGLPSETRKFAAALATSQQLDSMMAQAQIEAEREAAQEPPPRRKAEAVAP
jgi:hypothetical protein